MRCSSSMPVIVIAALLHPLKPSITAMRCFTLRWSCSIRLFRYFDERSFVSSGSKPLAFSSHRTVRCSESVQRDRLRAALLALDRFTKERLSGRDVAPGTQPEVARPARPINGSISLAPLASDLDLCLVAPP